MPPGGGELKLTLNHEESVELLLDRRHVRAVLEGETIQVSAKGACCTFHRRGDQIQVTCRWGDKIDRVMIEAADLEELMSSK